jgi:hypothetical protein
LSAPYAPFRPNKDYSHNSPLFVIKQKDKYDLPQRAYPEKKILNISTSAGEIWRFCSSWMHETTRVLLASGYEMGAKVAREKSSLKIGPIE